jgi:cytochrome oxidase Cu insertion factor (SCO1/SenC/PrrC family)
MARFFDLGMTVTVDTMITHTLSTTLIGSDGKVVRFYPGNGWTPEQVMADVARQSGPPAEAAESPQKIRK